MAIKPLNKFRKVSHQVLAQTFKLLLNGPITAHELAEHTGIHLVTAQEWLRSLRKEEVVHITGWLADSLGRDVTAVYSIGKGKDKPRHKLTPAQRTARYRTRKQQLLKDQMMGIKPL